MRHLGLLLCFSTSCLFSEYLNIKPTQSGPWFTGPLITPSAYTIPLGHYNFEPYLFVNNAFGLYNNHWNVKKFKETVSNINLQFWAQMGVASFMDFTLVPSFFYNYVGDESSWRFGDMFAQVTFQLTTQTGLKGFASKFAIGEIFPLGEYQHLEKGKLLTDSSGGGSFGTSFGFVFSKRWHTYSFHYFAARMSTSAILHSQVKVHGLNSYGGGHGTSGRVFPGTSFPLLFGFEYNLTQNWALALDVISTYISQTKFKGVSTKSVGWGPSYTLSFAPAIEYNFSANIGLVGGVWLTAIGRNSPQHINYVMALNWYI